MSIQLIHQYYNQVHNARRMGATTEGALSPYFHALVMHYALSKKYLFLREITIKSKKTGSNIRPDGILMNDLRVHRGYWESKDGNDILDEEIRKKLHEKGYPNDNILFEDTQTAVLIQGGVEVMRVKMSEAEDLHRVLSAFIDYKPADVIEFERALEAFKKDIPAIVSSFRELFDEQERTNKKYLEARNRFLETCKVEINPDITHEDVREMLIQHILTQDLFTAIFDDESFLRHNIIAKELEWLIDTVLTREVRKNKLGEIRHYYQTLNTTASSLADHHEKQQFLKTVYENFYKVYNPKGADRLGVVYTPNEIVRFMVESTDYLLDKYFNKHLHDKQVHILDPATGTGTFITDIIDYIPPQYLLYKYQNELHANEVSILPYYIANLNIEYTYQQKMGNYLEFPNICFVDTLDNVEALAYEGKQHSMFGLSSENTERIRRQNEHRISVVIGNPPYNANQQNFNDFNKNREYLAIDKRIKETFVKQSTAQKTKVYDMYARFYRWAMDRVDKNGIIAFITNRSFIDSRTFDGFRKIVQDDFQYAYILDTRSDVRANPKIAGTSHNVFGIQTGVAILFLIRKSDRTDQPCQIYYHSLSDDMRREDKLQWIKNNALSTISFERIQPSKENNWINLTDNNFDELLPIFDKKAVNTLFLISSNGILTARDEWAYDFSKSNLERKISFFINEYNADLKKHLANPSAEIKNEKVKYTSEVSDHIRRKSMLEYSRDCILTVSYRPFVKRYSYYNDIITHRQYQNKQIFPKDKKDNVNKLIAVRCISAEDTVILASKNVIDYAYLKMGNGGTFCLPLYRYSPTGERLENITDWGLAQFVAHYADERITKEAIFEYTYAVLHDPAYRTKYELNLKRDFPRLPFYADFWKWAEWGKALMDVHLNYETVTPYTLEREDKSPAQRRARKNKSGMDAFAELTQMLGNNTDPQTQVYASNKTRLKADKEAGIIEIDEVTYLKGIPARAWAYKLGNRSALEWILDQYKEKKIEDKTIAEKFDNYRFADYKEQVIDLLQRVITVSLRTMEIVDEMGE